MKDKDKTLKHLQELLERVPKVREAGGSSTDFKEWREESPVAIRHAFGENSDHLLAFKRIRFWPSVRSLSGNNSFSESRRSFEQGLGVAEAKLKAMITEVTEYWPSEPSNDAAKSVVRTDAFDASDRNVFVIHGHDEAAKHELARFLKQLDLDPVILSEKPSKGKTIIEKFNEYAAVGYAVALLTADDVGSPRHESTAKPRARQNVIFELGYFIGQLGRDRVCVLTKGKPEIPSDYAGVVYIPLESGDWQIPLVRELKAAGFNIDANKVI